MLIRSKDKREVFVLENATAFGICPCGEKDGKYFMCSRGEANIWGISFESDGEVRELGTYSTEDKAIRVLDMMMETYADYGSEAIFQMPQEDEIVKTFEL